MLIVYRTATGEIVDNTGMNDALPDGPPAALAYRNTDARSISRSDLSLLRLNDVTDIATIRRLLTERAHITDGRVEFDGEIEAPPAPPTFNDLWAIVQTLMLMVIGSKT